MAKSKFNNSEILIHQCNHWFNEYLKLIQNKNTNKNYNLIIEALGCAKGNLCALKEIDKQNTSLYNEILYKIDLELSYINSKKSDSKTPYLSKAPIFLDIKNNYNKLLN